MSTRKRNQKGKENKAKTGITANPCRPDADGMASVAKSKIESSHKEGSFLWEMGLKSESTGKLKGKEGRQNLEEAQGENDCLGTKSPNSQQKPQRGLKKEKCKKTTQNL